MLLDDFPKKCICIQQQRLLHSWKNSEIEKLLSLHTHKYIVYAVGRSIRNRMADVLRCNVSINMLDSVLDTAGEVCSVM